MNRKNQVLFHYFSELVGIISVEEIKRNKVLSAKASELLLQLSQSREV